MVQSKDIDFGKFFEGGAPTHPLPPYGTPLSLLALACYSPGQTNKNLISIIIFVEFDKNTHFKKYQLHRL